MIIQEDAYLEHYGKKGMHWGVRRDPKTGVRPVAARLDRSAVGRASKANADRHDRAVSNRELNRQSRAKDRAKMDKAIDKARSRTEGTTRAARLGLSDSGSKSHQEYKQARAQYKIDKQKMGSREARKILEKAREKRMEDVATSQAAKSGKETTVAILGGVGLIALSVLLTPSH